MNFKKKYQYVLLKRNEYGGFKHGSIRSAVRSINSHLPYLFVYSDFPDLNIPSTNNHLEGLFSHLKERIKIHRGLKEDRKKNAIRYLLQNLGNGG